MDRQDPGRVLKEKVRDNVRVAHDADVNARDGFRHLKPRPRHLKAAFEQEKKAFKKR